MTEIIYVESRMLPTLFGECARSSCPSKSRQPQLSGCLPTLLPSRGGGLHPGALEISWNSKIHIDAVWVDSGPECSCPSSPNPQNRSLPAGWPWGTPGCPGGCLWRPLPFTDPDGELLMAFRSGSGSSSW